MAKNSQQPADAIDFDAPMQANVARVFNERNPDRRRAAVVELYAKDATVYDPESVATGPEAISEQSTNCSKLSAGFRVRGGGARGWPRRRRTTVLASRPATWPGGGHGHGRRLL